MKAGGRYAGAATALEKAERLGCVHPYYLSWAGKCEDCRQRPLSPNLPDHYAKASRQSDEAGS